MIEIKSLKDEQGKECLKMSLTEKGAEHLAKDPHATLFELYDNERSNDSEKILIDFNTKCDTFLYTQIKILHEKDPFVVKVFKSKEDIEDIILKWTEDANKEFFFYPDIQNKEREKEATAKIAASTWAIYSPEHISLAGIKTQERYGQLKEAFESGMSIGKIFKYDSYKTDDEYYGKIKDLTTLIEKEMDFCIEKMKLMVKITGNDLSSHKRVNELYRSYRGVIQTDINVSLEK